MKTSAVKSTAPVSRTIAICGNPNSGKTTIFNAITGLNQRVGNYPGVTVEKVSGRFELPGTQPGQSTLIDIPGCYSLSAFSPDEHVATTALIGQAGDVDSPDVIICVVDSTNLERGLYLLFQVMQIGSPVVVALNMTDVAERHGILIDFKKLSQRLGNLPVIPVVGNKGTGINELKKAIAKVLTERDNRSNSFYSDTVLDAVERLASDSNNGHRTSAEYLRIIFDENGPAELEFIASEGNERKETLSSVRNDICSKYGALSSGETISLTSSATELLDEVLIQKGDLKQSITSRVDRLLLHSVAGPILLVLVMTLMFQSVFSWAAPVMNMIDLSFGSLANLVSSSMSEGPLRSLLTDGIIGGVGSVLVFLPQIVILFFFIALLEDSGYMPRAAFLVDRLFGWCGLSGKSFIPMLSSFACAVPGIMATRTIEDRKLRLITIIVSPLMSCSARLPVYTIMIAAFVPQSTILGFVNLQGAVLTSLYLLGIIVAVPVSFILSRLILRTERGTFLMEMPSYKLPTARSIMIRVLNRVKSFLVRAGTVILAITIVIWALSYFPRSDDLSSRNNETSQSSQDISTGTNLAQSGAHGLSADAEKNIRNMRASEQLRQSYLGRLGRTIEPVFEPLGWDWRITVATLASFPAREVVIATLGTIFNLGSDASMQGEPLVDKLRNATWDSGERKGKPLFTPAVALSIMIFFALSCQCGATLATMRQETNGKTVPILTFIYMTLLAYGAAFLAYELFTKLGW